MCIRTFVSTFPRGLILRIKPGFPDMQSLLITLKTFIGFDPTFFMSWLRNEMNIDILMLKVCRQLTFSCLFCNYVTQYYVNVSHPQNTVYNYRDSSKICCHLPSIFKEWVSFFQGSWGMNCSAGQNKSREPRSGSRTICLFRATIHSPWTQTKRHSFLIFTMLPSKTLSKILRENL